MMNSIKEIYWTYSSVDEQKNPVYNRVGGVFVFILFKKQTKSQRIQP